MQANAQVVKTKLKWLSDTIMLGKPTQVLLLLDHPHDLTVSISDSLQYFLPYELLSKKIYRMELSPTQVRDSIIYSIVSYEVDTVQFLRINYSYPQAQGYVRQTTAPDSIYFNTLVPFVEPSIQYRPIYEVTDPPELSKNLIWVFVLTGFTVVLLLGYFFFKRPIIRWFKVILLNREKRKLLTQVQTLSQYYAQPTAFIYQLNRVWKIYLSQQKPVQRRLQHLESAELLAMSSTELQNFWQNQSYVSPSETQILTALVTAENQIYFAHESLSPQELQNCMQYLINFFELEFRRRKHLIR